MYLYKLEFYFRMPPRRERAERADAREEAREGPQDQQGPPPPPPEMISATQVAMIVSQAIETAIRAMVAHFPHP